MLRTNSGLWQDKNPAPPQESQSLRRQLNARRLGQNRTFSQCLRALVFAVAVIPVVAGAQQTPRVYRVALVYTTSPVSELSGPEPVHPGARAFVHGLRNLGYVEGQNLVLERRSAEGKFERFPEIIRGLVSSKMDVIVTLANPATRAAKAVTQTIPIIMVAGGDPVEEGLVQSLARPGGNITGLTVDTGPELVGKRLQLLNEILPAGSRVMFLASGDEVKAEGKQIIAAATKLRLRLLFAEHAPTEYGEAFAHIARERPDALLVAQSAQNFGYRQQIVDFAAKNRLPAMYANREFADLGGLIAYGVEIVEITRRTVQYIDKILKGANPATLPVERPTKFELVINLKTAKTLGLTIPPSLVQQADHIIQ
ncbi:MAG TPA: ABC transporter substrate-binding protein [Burkholderiales bacterium]|nr:ABC transporter substrate-binding protein [Burkholderiales bacterium]